MMERMLDQPLIAVDVVPVRFTAKDGLQVGTATRANEPYAGRQALPGVLLDGAELLSEAAYRALESKAGVASSDVLHLIQIGAFDRPDRDPRSHALSIAFVAVIAPGATSTAVWDSADLRSRNLPFFHDEIIDEALSTLRARLWADLWLTRALTGTTFPTNVASALTEALTGLKPRASTLHRDLTNNPQVDRLEPSAGNRAGRPSITWKWVG